MSKVSSIITEKQKRELFKLLAMAVFQNPTEALNSFEALNNASLYALILAGLDKQQAERIIYGSKYDGTAKLWNNDLLEQFVMFLILSFADYSSWQYVEFTCSPFVEDPTILVRADFDEELPQGWNTCQGRSAVEALHDFYNPSLFSVFAA